MHTSNYVLYIYKQGWFLKYTDEESLLKMVTCILTNWCLCSIQTWFLGSCYSRVGLNLVGIYEENFPNSIIKSSGSEWMQIKKKECCKSANYNLAL